MFPFAAQLRSTNTQTKTAGTIAAFVIHVSTPETAAQNSASVHSDVPFVSDSILDVFSDPLLKPPTDLFV